MVAKIRLSNLSGATIDLTEMFAAISNIIISKYALGRVYEGDGNKNFAALSKPAMELTGAFCFEDLSPILGWMDNLTVNTNLFETSISESAEENFEDGSLDFIANMVVTTRKKLNLPPSPPKLPRIGNFHQLGALLHHVFRVLFEKYGPVLLLRLGNTPTLIVSSVEKIYVQELLSQRRVQAFQFVRDEEVAKMVGKIRLSSLNGAAINLTDMFAVISNNIISRTALGRVYEGQGNKGFTGLSISIFKWMDHLSGLAAKLRITSKTLHSFLDQVIEEHQVSNGEDDKSDKKDFVDLLLHLQKEGGLDIDLTQESIKSILLDMFIGGTDTTATTMEWATTELVKNPMVGDKSKIDENDVNQMEYLKCIVKEALRLHAPVMITRATTTSTKLEGYDIPPKTIVLINAWAIQRDPKLCNRLEEFILERFANILVDFNGQHNQFIPFGAGRRGCPGLRFATIKAEYVLANLLCWFDWKLPDCGRGEDLDMSDVYVLVIRKKFPLHLVPVMRSS
ncbi:hypothetical protein ACOSQ3_025700 [Xanthoceras sorbifolium]